MSNLSLVIIAIFLTLLIQFAVSSNADKRTADMMCLNTSNVAECKIKR